MSNKDNEMEAGFLHIIEKLGLGLVYRIVEYRDLQKNMALQFNSE